MLPGDFLQRANLLIHRETGRQAVIQNIIGQYPKAFGDGSRVPANYLLRVATLNQFLHFFWLVEANGNMLL